MPEPAPATLDELRDALGRARSESEHLAAQAAELDARAEDRFADAGACLAPRREWWRFPAELAPSLAEADRLVARIAALDRRLARLPTPAVGHSGWRRVRAAGARRGRERAAARLRAALVTIAQVGAPAAIDVPDVRPMLEEAAELQARVRHLRFSLDARARRLAELEREIERREQATRLMGFDSIHLAASFARYGLPEIESPYELENGEVAYAAVEASRVRMRPGSRYLVAGAGAMPSPAFTGLPSWMGAFRDRAAPAGSGETDPGVLLLTSRRLAFAGASESAAIWLDAAVDMDVYRDAIAVHHLAAERPLLLRVAAPRQVAFSINWAMRRAAGTRPE